ncbi:MAG: aminotransferase class III-fold pyridoxal phosphate-dependent enzyme [Actinobacteria bacterium]|nr:aminotransferase class III-fold pyridoxal phosphate-dependent enzyme [Actinomycetota bacterium]
MKTYRYEKSEALRERALAVIPSGTPGHLRHTEMEPDGAYPWYAVSGKGSRFTDLDGNEFIDYVCAFGPSVLGYCHPGVTEAVEKQLRLGNALSQPTPNVVELAEELTDLVTAADWAFFCKNGTDVTRMAALVSRAATGRSKVILISGGYHGTATWMQQADNPGVRKSDLEDVIYVEWNDLDQLRSVIAENEGEIAAFMAAPYWQPLFGDDVMPAEGYWQTVRDLCTRNGIVLVVDDVRCGFRLDLRGSSEYFGFTPDLTCFSKAIANGHSLSALVGLESLKETAASVNSIGTFWYEATSFAAALATIRELRRLDAVKLMMDAGTELSKGLTAAAAEHGFEFVSSGAPSLASFRIVTEDGDFGLSSQWSGECTRRGAYIFAPHNHFMTTAHTPEDIARTVEIASEAFAVVAERQTGRPAAAAE